jgi:deoxyribodipyrimidine photo-lyase
MPPKPTPSFDATPVPTRAAGLARLADFLPRSSLDYARTRNHDLGPDDRSNVSGLSPYIRHRLITETEVLDAIREGGGEAASGAFIAQVFWRVYFKGWLETRPSVWRAYRRDLGDARARLGADPGLRRAYDAAIEGRVGVDAFDAFARELVATGYLHNHARMWFASIWIFTLDLPWTLGADFTLRHFIDGDPAVNTLSWRWVAGLHTRGKTYLARRDNIAAFTGGRFDPEGLAATAPALEEPPLPPAVPIAPLVPPRRDGRLGLLLHPEDLRPESLPLDETDFEVAIAADADLGRAGMPGGAAALTFRRGALADGAARAAAWTGAPLETAASLDGATLVALARRHDLRAIVTPYAPVGPVADALAEAEPHLADAGVALIRIRRRLDEHAWPLATRGYFSFKDHIPDLLRLAFQDTPRAGSK